MHVKLQSCMPFDVIPPHGGEEEKGMCNHVMYLESLRPEQPMQVSPPDELGLRACRSPDTPLENSKLHGLAPLTIPPSHLQY